MTDKRVPPNGRRHPPEDVAYQLWTESGRPSLHQLSRNLGKMGYSVDTSTLMKWKDKNPEWLNDFQNQQNPKKPATIIEALRKAKDDATELSVEHYIGVKAQLVARLYETIKEMRIETVDEWLKALDACDRIEGLIHDERGKAVAGMDTIAVPRGAKPSLINRLDPPVALPAFKKANGSAG